MRSFLLLLLSLGGLCGVVFAGGWESAAEHPSGYDLDACTGMGDIDVGEEGLSMHICWEDGSLVLLTPLQEKHQVLDLNCLSDEFFFLYERWKRGELRYKVMVEAYVFLRDFDEDGVKDLWVKSVSGSEVEHYMVFRWDVTRDLFVPVWNVSHTRQGVMHDFYEHPECSLPITYPEVGIDFSSEEWFRQMWLYVLSLGLI